MKKSLTIDDFKKVASLKGGKCLSKTYKGDRYKLHWECEFGHRWFATPGHVKNSGSWCPECAGHVTENNNLLFKFSDLVNAEWDFEKNDILPNNVKPTSQHRVWWKCEQGHSYYQSIATRVNPKKHGSKVCPTCNSFLSEKSELMTEWDAEKNKDLKPKNLRSNSNRKVWWKCVKGHSWCASISNRVKNNSNCPYCVSGVSTSKQELRLFSEMLFIFNDVKHREKVCGVEVDVFLFEYKIAIEYDGVYWHKDKTSKDIEKTKKLNKCGCKVFRVRENGLSPISKNDIICRQKGLSVEDIKKLIRKLPVKNSTQVEEYLLGTGWMNDAHYRDLEKEHPMPLPGRSIVDEVPELLVEWSSKNYPFSPEQFTKGSHQKVLWKCKKCAREWRAGIKDRVLSKQGCPYCSGNRVSCLNSVSSKGKVVLKYWDYERNKLGPNEISYGTSERFWWLCDRGHSYRMSPKAKIGQGQRCPYCAGKRVDRDSSFGSKFPKLVRFWDKEKNGKLTPYDVTPRSGNKVWWKCPVDKGHGGWLLSPEKMRKRVRKCQACGF